jgi:hypothetical protein
MAQRNRKKDKSIYSSVLAYEIRLSRNKLNYLSSRNLLRPCDFAVKKNIDFIDLSDFESHDSYL